MEDTEGKRIEEMAEQMDEYYKQRKEYKMEIDRKLMKKDKKNKMLID